MTRQPAFLERVRLLPERVEDAEAFPFTLKVVRGLDLRLSPLTVFVGENGSGKSTLLQAIAELAGLPGTGGGRDQGSGIELGKLADACRPSWKKRPRRSWFFRADRQVHFADWLVEHGGRHAMPWDSDALFADRELSTLSHGEAFLAILNNRAKEGLLLLDEPESALSPQRQLSLIALLHDRLRGNRSQVVIATHSPILMSMPGAELLSFDGEAIAPIELEDTSHFQVMQGVLERPELYWRHLLEGEG